MSSHQDTTLGDAGASGAFDGAVGVLCSTSWLPLADGEILVLRIAGDVDSSTFAVLRTALADAVSQRPDYLVVDLVGMTFCGVQGLVLLSRTGITAASRGTSYAFSGARSYLNRIWMILGLDPDLPIQHPTAAAAVHAAMMNRADASLASAS